MQEHRTSWDNMKRFTVMGQADIAQWLATFLAVLIPILAIVWLCRSGRQSLPPPTEITALYIHPIKSCHGLSVRSAKLLPTGLDLDRHWMWVDYPKHTFLTIRQNARMTLIRPTYDAETDMLTVTAPAPGSIDQKLQFSIPAHPSKEWLAENTSEHDVSIWRSPTPANVYSPELTAPFNKLFGKEVRLVYKSPYSETPRLLRSNGAVEILGRVGSTCFPDLMPILVANESSINHLNQKIRESDSDAPNMDIRRFRPNILVRGQFFAPWDEDRWKTLRIIGDEAAQVSKPSGMIVDVTQRCARCQVPNVHPDTAEKHKRQPWNTMMNYRRIDTGQPTKPCFGILCVPREGGKIKVGMTLEVTEVTDKHHFITGAALSRNRTQNA